MTCQYPMSSVSTGNWAGIMEAYKDFVSLQCAAGAYILVSFIITYVHFDYLVEDDDIY